MTKDEFLDVMGEIDERLIDSTLDVSRMDTIYLPYKRRSPLRYFIGAAACLALVFAVAGVLQYFIGSPFISAFISGSDDGSDSGASGVSTVSSSSGGKTSVPVYREPDYVRGWDPGIAEFDPTPEIGSTAVVSTAELDGITVSLVLHNITKLPGTAYSEHDFDYTDYWGAKDIVLYAEDSGRRKVAEEAVTPHGGEVKFLHKDCVFDGSTRLYETSEMRGASTLKSYIAMQYIDRDARTGALIASFLKVDMDSGARRDEYGIADNGLIAYGITGVKRIGGWKYGYQASEDFDYNEGTTFTDPVYGYELNITSNGRASVTYPTDGDPNNMTGFDPDKTEYKPYPEIGETAVVSVGEADGMKAELIMYNVVKRPGEDNYLYRGDGWRDMWIAENIYLYITDDQERRVLGTLGTTLVTDDYKQLPGECLFEGCTRVYKTDGGRFLIMQYYDYDAESGEFSARFTQGDTGQYASSLDENGIYIGGELKLITVSGLPDGKATKDVRVSESFEYQTGTTFADTELGYTVTFDFDKNTAQMVVVSY